MGATEIVQMVEPAASGAVYDDAKGQVTEVDAGLLMTIDSEVVAACAPAALAATNAPAIAMVLIALMLIVIIVVLLC